MIKVEEEGRIDSAIEGRGERHIGVRIRGVYSTM